MKSIDYQEIQTRIEEYIRDFTRGKSTIIGLSGGIDSSIVCDLAVNALGRDKVKPLIVKNTRYSKEGLETAREYAKEQGLELQEVDTENIREQTVKVLNINEENIIQTSTLDARICDTMIRTTAILENRIYLGTINGTERLTGWYPKGSLVGDFCPIGGLLKEQEKKLAKHMSLDFLIETISDDASEVCSGCGELPEFKGIPYKTLDKVLHIYETSKGDELARNLGGSEIDSHTYRTILDRVLSVNHKNDVFPDYCKINFPNGDKQND